MGDKDAYFFPHDSNAKDDPKMVMLIEQLGLEGYGIYWILVETLREQPGYRYPIILIGALARRYNTTAEKMKTVVEKYGLFRVEDEEFFFSESLRNRMLPWEKKKEDARLAGKRSAEVRALKVSGLPTTVEPLLNEGSTRREYNRREEKRIKENNIKEREQKFKLEVESFKDKYSIDMLTNFYAYWSEPTQDKKKMKMEREATWDTARRLLKCSNNIDKWKK